MDHGSFVRLPVCEIDGERGVEIKFMLNNNFKLQNSNFKINPKFQIKKFGFRQWDLFWILILGCWILTSCSTSYDARGVFHRTREGETLVWVAKAYCVELQDLAEMNNI